MNVKSKPLQEVLQDVPEGVDKSDWKWLVKEHFLSEKFKEEIQELLQVEPSPTNIEVVERCFGPQSKSHVVGFGGGITRKDLKGGSSAKVALLEQLNVNRKEKVALIEELNASRKENESIKRRMDNIEKRCEIFESAIFRDPLSPPSSREQNTS
uniref:Transposon protein, CACTA, En/Spm sub-class n=1 Tax=Solanum tuberosum TaxID=4113 RepID=M1DVP9_SOLTU